MDGISSIYDDTAPEMLKIAAAHGNHSAADRFANLSDYRNEELLSAGVRFYIGDGYEAINGYLNNPATDLTYSDSKSEDIIRMLTEVIRDMRPLSQDMVVFRGIRLDRDNDVLEAGVSVDLPALTSTSVSREVAVRFASGDCIINLRIPMGTPVIATDRQECEIILPPGVRVNFTNQYNNVQFPYVEEHTGNLVYTPIRRVLIGEVDMGE